MSLTYLQARNEIFVLVKAALDSVPITDVAWPDMEFDVPTSETAWARVSLDILTGAQAAFSDGVAGRRFRRDGLLSLQFFHPLGGGSTDAMNTAKIVADALEGAKTAGGVWFRDLTGPSTIGASGGFSQLNLTVAFVYDEVK